LVGPEYSNACIGDKEHEDENDRKFDEDKVEWKSVT
jgi:hypothetical protein